MDIATYLDALGPDEAYRSDDGPLWADAEPQSPAAEPERPRAAD